MPHTSDGREEPKRRRSSAHKPKYDPHYRSNATEHHHKAAKGLQKLVRGDSGRKVAELAKQKKKEAEKKRHREQQKKAKERGIKGQPQDSDGEEQSFNYDSGRAESASKKHEHKKHTHEVRAEPGAYNHFTSANKNKVHVVDDHSSHSGNNRRQGGLGDNYLVDRNVPGRRDPRDRTESDEPFSDLEAGSPDKPEHLVIFDGDDEETKAYKAKLNYLADQKHKEKNNGGKGGGGGGGDDDDDAKTDAKDDCCVLSCLGVVVLGYYGLCAYLWIEVSPLIAVFLGLLCPLGLIFTVKSWNTAKKEGKRAIFLW
jgi:hypothetical protein